MVEFTNLTGAIGLEGLFQAARADPRLVATNEERRTFAAGLVTVLLRPLDVIGLLQRRRPVGFLTSLGPGLGRRLEFTNGGRQDTRLA